jgi:peptidoglycan/xylan/chitin deacetylase (PgdA/CDA1 family)
MQLQAAWYIFYYHDVSANDRVPTSVRTSPQRFASEIRFLKSHFDVVAFDAGLKMLRDGACNRACASLCFDDGFRGVLENALPVLRREGVPHILFLNGAFLDGEAVSDAVIAYHMARNWLYKDLAEYFPDAKDPRRPGTALRHYMHPDRFPRLWSRVKSEFDWRNLFLSHASLSNFPSDLTQFGSHTRRHYWLAGLSREHQESEIGENHRLLRELPGYRSLLALPFGTADCFDETTLAVNDAVHGDVVIKAVGGIQHRHENGRWFLERIGLSDDKPRIDDLIRERMGRRNFGYRLRKLGRKIHRSLERSSGGAIL